MNTLGKAGYSLHAFPADPVDTDLAWLIVAIEKLQYVVNTQSK